MNDKIPLIVISGPTGSGKTGLAIDICKNMNGEVVSADSMQIYKYMNIGTAKPSKEEMQGITHHLMDFLSPDENYSVANFVEDAKKIIEDIHRRGKLAVLVGGTGLYINSLVDNIEFTKEDKDEELRNELLTLAKEKGNEYVWNMLNEIDEDSAKVLHPNNIYRVIRAIEVYKTTGKTMYQAQIDSRNAPSPYNPIMIALSYNDRQILYDRINKRVDQMIDEGLLQEVQQMIDKGFSQTAAQAIGYKEFLPYINSKEKTPELLNICIEKLKMETRRYAKRQLTWLRRDKRYFYIYKDTINNNEVLNIATEYIKEKLGR